MTRVSRTKGYRRFYGDAGKGWIIVSNGKEDISIPIGSDGTLLKADSSTPSGLSWTDLAPEFMEYIGNWDASTNTPTLQDGSSNDDSDIGNVYRVNVAGTQDLGSGSLTFEIGDFVILNNAKVWERAPGAGAKVTSVNGEIGDVVLDTDDVSEGSTNKYFADSLAKDAVVVNSLAGSETDQSPSVAAVNSALGSIVIPQEIIEADDLASFPVSGEAEKVYVAKDTNKLYRWDGAAYQELSPSAGGVVEFDQEVYVSKNGNDGTADGSLSSPFLTVKAAMASITDASPTKRYAIKVASGNYSETGDFELKANVFIMGAGKDVTRIGATSFKLNADFSGSADNRSGFSDCVLLNPCDFDWDSVSSQAGKLYFNHVIFNSTLRMVGFNNGIAQAQMLSTLHFGLFQISGINLLTIANRFYAACEMNQHPILASIWDAHGGSTGDMDIITTVNDFNRRCSMFARSFLMENLVVDGPVSYCDYTASSLGLVNSTANGGQLVPMNPSSVGANLQLSNLSFPTSLNNPIIPNSSSSINHGDWSRQFAWSFSWISASTGSDKYLISYPSSFGAESAAGKNIGIYADGAGLAPDINGGSIYLGTAAASGTGVQGRVEIDARELGMNNKKIVDLAPATANTDAVNLGQLTTAFSDRYRADSVALGNGVSTASVTFDSPLPTANYTLTYSLVNLTDPNPKFLDILVTSKSTTGFTIRFHQNTDSSNYLLEFIAIIHS